MYPLKTKMSSLVCFFKIGCFSTGWRITIFKCLLTEIKIVNRN